MFEEVRLFMFEMYKSFVSGKIDKIFHPQISSFSGYIKVVLDGILLITSALLTLAIVIGIIAMPFMIYKMCIKKISDQICELGRMIDHHEQYELTEEQISTNKLLIKKAYTKRKIYISLLAALLLLIYVPMIVPLIFIILDIIDSYVLLIIFMCGLFVFSIFIEFRSI